MAGSKDRPQPRHRAAPPPPADEALPDDELDSYLKALAPEAGGTDSELTGRFGSAQVFQLRLPALRIEQLRRLATERGTTPAALAVGWVLERLDQVDTPTGPLPVTEPAP